LVNGFGEVEVDLHPWIKDKLFGLHLDVLLILLPGALAFVVGDLEL